MSSGEEEKEKKSGESAEQSKTSEEVKTEDSETQKEDSINKGDYINVELVPEPLTCVGLNAITSWSKHIGS